MMKITHNEQSYASMIDQEKKIEEEIPKRNTEIAIGKKTNPVFAREPEGLMSVRREGRVFALPAGNPTPSPH